VSRVARSWFTLSSLARPSSRRHGFALPPFSLASLTYLCFALVASTLGLLWPSMRLSLGQPVGALGLPLTVGVAASVLAAGFAAFGVAFGTADAVLNVYAAGHFGPRQNIWMRASYGLGGGAAVARVVSLQVAASAAGSVALPAGLGLLIGAVGPRALAPGLLLPALALIGIGALLARAGQAGTAGGR
jgi:hypothetical protein